jgi:hypothetical protein
MACSVCKEESVNVCRTCGTMLCERHTTRVGLFNGQCFCESCGGRASFSQAIGCVIFLLFGVFFLIAFMAALR